MKDWRQVEKIFGAALELEPAERPKFLEEACGVDLDLRREVESLLASYEEISATFLEKPPSAGEPVILPTPPSSGETVGAYRLIEKIGEGGMGAVFLGERADGAFDRQVAVKVLRHGMESDTALLRFDLERRILAGLDHPGIARLLDGGTTASGAPYVVMELVDGKPIDHHCNLRGLSTEERVDLFLEVTEAVASAHRSLVIHRDIKPSNVLVDHQGRAKLLDFGIAKILDPERKPGLGEMTESWSRVLTPGYASPEQMRGERSTVATDVYLLGILLYKLLTDRLPYEVKGRSLAEVEAILSTERPKPPSRLLREVVVGDADGKPPKGVDRIDSDLDHIILKALRSDAAERYGSVSELIEDLRRFRTGRPIRAREGNRRYQVRKFAQRHWRALSLAGLAFLFLALFTVDRTIQVERREQALARAEASLTRSEGLWTFVENLFWQADPEAAKGRELTVAEAVSRGEEKLAQGKGGPPEVEAMIYALFGRIRYDLGQYKEAYSSLQTALERFAEVGELEEPLRIAELRARGDFALARLHRLETLADEGAEEAVAEAIAIARHAYEESRWLEVSEPALALELSNPLAEIYCLLERWQDAAPLTEEAMTLVDRAKGAKTHPVAKALARRALILKNLDGELEEAQKLYAKALDIYLDLEGEIHPEVANLRNQLALLDADLGNIAAAFTSHQEALKVRKKLYPDGHLTIHQSYGHFAKLFRVEGDLDCATHDLMLAADLSRKLHGPTSSRTIRYTLRLCEVLIEDGQPAKAEALLLAELTPKRRAARPEGSRLIVKAEGLLGAAMLAQGRDDGESLIRQSLKTLRGFPEGYEDVIAWFETFLEKNLPPV